jgi:hypothetical protein
MVPAGYVQGLVDYAEIFGAVAVQQIKDELVTLFERKNAEGGLAVVNSTLSGKSFGFQVNMTLEEKFSAFAQAYKILAGDAGNSPITFLDYSRMGETCS